MIPLEHVNHAPLIRTDPTSRSGLLPGMVRIRRIVSQAMQSGTLSMHTVGGLVTAWHCEAMNGLTWQPYTPLIVRDSMLRFTWTGPLCFVQVDVEHSDGYAVFMLKPQDWFAVAPPREPMARPRAREV